MLPVTSAMLSRPLSLLPLDGIHKLNLSAVGCASRYFDGYTCYAQINQNHRASILTPIRANRFALHYYQYEDEEKLDIPDRCHKIWMANDVDEGSNETLVQAMQIKRASVKYDESYTSDYCDRVPTFITQPCEGLHLMVTDICIRVLNLASKDILVLPGSCALNFDGNFPGQLFQSASMEYDHRTHKYKIVRMLMASNNADKSYRCQVYTLGTNAKWVEAETTSSWRFPHGYSFYPPVFANGAHHWLEYTIQEDEYPYRVVAFNANDGSYKVFPLKPNEDVCLFSSPSMFVDKDSGNVCLLVPLDGGLGGGDLICGAEIWTLKVEAGFDATNGAVIWSRIWKGHLPPEVFGTIWMENQKLLFTMMEEYHLPDRATTLAWYDLNNHKEYIVNENTPDNLNGPSCTMGVMIYDEKLASEILNNERGIIASVAKDCLNHHGGE